MRRRLVRLLLLFLCLLHLFRCHVLVVVVRVVVCLMEVQVEVDGNLMLVCCVRVVPSAVVVDFGRLFRI